MNKFLIIIAGFSLSQASICSEKSAFNPDFGKAKRPVVIPTPERKPSPSATSFNPYFQEPHEVFAEVQRNPNAPLKHWGSSGEIQVFYSYEKRK